MSDLLQRYDSLKNAALLSVRQTESLDGVVQDILTGIVLDTLQKYQQKVNVGIQDSVSDLLDNFKQKVAEAIFDIAGTWKVANREPMLFPRGCRFCYTRGRSTIFVIEQDPQVRSLSCASGILEEQPEVIHGTEYISLALPYIVFVVHFVENRFANLYCGWRTHALTNLDDMLSRPLLPNIHDTLSVCMGSGAPAHYSQGSLAERTSSVLDTFWNSTFNNDISDAWWKKGDMDDRLWSARAWAEQSARYSAFILGIHFPPNRSLQFLIDLLVMHEQEPDENTFRHKLAEDIDQCVENLFAGVMRYFKKTKFERYYPQEITDSVRHIMQGAVVELVDIVFALNVEIQRLAKDVQPQPRLLTGAGKNWHTYKP